MDEQWMDIAGYPGYRISDLGRVWSEKTKRHLTAGKMQKGYLHVTLCRNNKPKTFRLNRLVLKTFVGSPPFDGAESAHIDGDKENNRLANLYWATPAENVKDRQRHGGYRSGFDHVNCKIKLPEIEFAIQRRGDKATWLSIAAQLGVNADTLSARVRSHMQVAL